MSDKIEPEFSRIFEVSELDGAVVSKKLTATEEELQGLLKRFGVETLNAVGADLKIEDGPESAVLVSGTVRASLSQICVVSLDPVDEVIEEPIAVTFLPEASEAFVEEEAEEISDADLEPFDGETLDLGEMVAQQIAAAINPYPRKDGVEFGFADSLEDNGKAERENPFAVLSKLKGGEGPDQAG